MTVRGGASRIGEGLAIYDMDGARGRGVREGEEFGGEKTSLRMSARRARTSSKVAGAERGQCTDSAEDAGPGDGSRAAFASVRTCGGAYVWEEASARVREGGDTCKELSTTLRGGGDACEEA